MALTQITEKGIKDGEIVNADINASAAIAKSKLAALDIVNADINSSAAIAGSKISPVFTSNIEIQNTAPGITFTDTDQNNDFYIQTDANVLKFVDGTSGTIRFTIDGNGYLTANGDLDVLGNFEVGQTSANAKLKVSNTTGVIGYFESTQAAANVDNIVLNSTQTNSSSNLVFQINGGATAQGIIRLNGDNSLDFYNGATPTFKARLNSSGSLGLGTTTPGRVIHAYGSSSILKLESTNNEAYIQLTTLNQANETYIGLVSGDIYMSTTGTGSSGNGERFRIKANGRIGVNASTPSATLSVFDPNGDNVTAFFNTTATANYIQISDSVNNHCYIAKENSANRSQVAFYATKEDTTATQKVAHFDYRGLVLPAGKGVSFSPHDDPYSAANNTNSNRLDDYEEGNFTPVITGSTTDPTQSYVAQEGYYVKVGRIVHIAVDIEFASSGISYGSGYALLSNLPFNKQNSGQHYGITMGVGYSPNWTGNGAPTGGYMQPNTTYSYLMPYNSNGNTFTMANEVSNGTRLIAGITYMTND